MQSREAQGKSYGGILMLNMGMGLLGLTSDETHMAVENVEMATAKFGHAL